MADDDDDTDLGLAGLSPEFQAMVGGLAGHTASFARLIERRTQSGYMSKDAANKKDDEVYLESYADLGIHEDMLKDAPRVDAYRKAIEAHAAAWKEQGDVKVVDVGSGTGLLAIFAARAGAKKVFAVEASRLAHFLPDIMKKNVPDGVVEVKECRAEALELDCKVDCVVSEWMGYFLLFENMLPSVFAVRDKYLKPGGKMLPSACRLTIAPMEDNTWKPGKVDFWKNVHGIDMSALMPLAKAGACDQGQHRIVGMDSVIGPSLEVLHLDLYTATEADLHNFEAPFSCTIPAGRRLDGFVSWFDCEFAEAGWLLSTAPNEAPTHWRQTAFHFRQPIEGGGGITVEGKIVVSRHEEFSRGYRVQFELAAPGRKPRTERFELR